MVSCTQINMRPRRPWGAANCETVASFVGCWRDQDEASPPMGAANCETVAAFVGSWEVQRSDVLRTSRRDLAAPWGCELRKYSHFRALLGGPAE